VKSASRGGAELPQIFITGQADNVTEQREEIPELKEKPGKG
jgi:hypothetical protein